jgi:dTDP-4-amino-4,6-dideoxygalactose transaminase
MRHLPEAVESRQTIAARYNRWFKEAGMVGEDNLVLPYHDPAAFHVFNQYALRIPGGRRDSLRAFLSEQNVGSEIYYPIPVHSQECYEDMKFSDSQLPETIRACEEILNLPIFPSMTESEQRRVVDTVCKFYSAGQNRMAA